METVPSLADLCARIICKKNLKLPPGYECLGSKLWDHLQTPHFHGYCMGCGGKDYYMAIWAGPGQGLCPTCYWSGGENIVVAADLPTSRVKCIACGRKTYASRRRGTYTKDFQRFMMSSLSRMGFPNMNCQLCDTGYSHTLMSRLARQQDPRPFTCSICSRSFGASIDDGDCPLWHRLGQEVKREKDILVCETCRPRRFTAVVCTNNIECPLHANLRRMEGADFTNWTQMPHFIERVHQKCYQPFYPLLVTRDDIWVFENLY